MRAIWPARSLVVNAVLTLCQYCASLRAMQIRLALYIPEELNQAIEAEAARLGLSKADVVRLALLAKLKAEGLTHETPVSVAIEPQSSSFTR